MPMKKLLAALALLVVSLVIVAMLVVVLFGPRPTHYTVIRGDTLGKIAKSHGVSVDELQSWNGLEGDLIEVGQVLDVWPAAAQAPAVATSRPQARTVAGVVSASSSTLDAALPKPAAKACIPPPALDALTADEGWVSSAGLSYEQISAAMKRFVGHTLTCVPEGTSPAGTIQTEITVACTGLVTRVEILDDGGLPGEMVDCVAKTLYFAPFPAHDLPDGEAFGYPLTFRF